MPVACLLYSLGSLLALLGILLGILLGCSCSLAVLAVAVLAWLYLSGILLGTRCSCTRCAVACLLYLVARPVGCRPTRQLVGDYGLPFVGCRFAAERWL